jgi:hypothetical protein
VALLNRVVEGSFADRRYLDQIAVVTKLEELLPTIARMPRGISFEKKLDQV